jgi:hypothetical protein
VTVTVSLDYKRGERYLCRRRSGTDTLGRNAVRFARYAFGIAGVYGLVTLIPMYFAEPLIAEFNPPALNHPEHFYGFIGIALAWQVLFLMIARDPLRLRVAMVPAVLEKLAFGVPAIVLYLQHRLASPTLMFGLIDLALGALFVVSYRKTATSAA